MGVEDGSRADMLLEMVGLGSYGGRKVGGYSWGMKRRLGIAAALLGDPELLLLDEPTNGLDPSGIADMRTLLPRLAREEGRTVFLSSHRMEEVSQICDHVTIINRGAIVASGTPDELSSAETWVEIESPGADEAARLLEESGMIEETRRVNTTMIEVRTRARAASEVNAFIVERGVEVTGVREKRESLEEIFFRLTSEGGGDDEG